MARRAGGMAFSCNWLLFCMWPCVFFFFFGLLQLAINMHFRVTNAWQRLTGRNFLGSSLPRVISPTHLISPLFLLLLPSFLFPVFLTKNPTGYASLEKEKRNIYPRNRHRKGAPLSDIPCTHTHTHIDIIRWEKKE